MAGRDTDFSLKMGADISDLESKLSKARQSIENFGSNAQVAAKGMRDLFNVQGLDQLASQFSGVEQVVNKLGTTFSKTGGSTKQQLRVLQQAATDLTMVYRGLSQAEQQSAQGQALSQYISQLVGKAGELKDAMGDVTREIGNMASDTRNFDVLANGMQVVATTAQIAGGAMTMLGVEESKVAQVQQKLTSIIAVTNGLQQLQNALQKESALMQALRNLRMKIATAIENANTKAIQANTVAERTSMMTTKQDTAAKAANTIAETVNGAATKKGTIIQQAWNVAKAVAKALVGDFSGLLIVGAGILATYAIATAKSTDEIENQSDALKDNNDTADSNLTLKERLKKSEKEWAEEVTRNASTQIEQYTRLQLKWQQCNTDQKLREKFQKEYGDEVNRVAGRVLKLSEYEDFFVKNTDDVVNAILARAAAEAGAQKYAEALLKQKENDRNGTVDNGRYYYNVHRQLDHGNNSASGEEIQAYQRATGKVAITGGGGQSSQGYVLTEAAQKWIEQRRKDAANARKALDQRNVDDAHDLAQELARDAEKKRQAAGMGSGYTPPSAYGGTGGHPGGHGSSGSSGKGGSGTTKPQEQVKPLEQSLEWLRQRLRKLQQDLSYGLIPDNAIESTKTEIESLKKQIEEKEIELGFKVVPIEGSLEKLQAQLNKKKSDLEKGLVPDDQIEATNKQIDDLVDRISEKRIQLGIDVAPETAYEKTEKLRKEFFKGYKDYLRNITSYAKDDDQYQKQLEVVRKYNEERERASENSSDDIPAPSQETLQREAKQREELAKLTEQFQKGEITVEQYDKAMEHLGGTLDEVVVEAPQPLKKPITFDMGNIPQQYQDAIAEIDRMLNEDDLTIGARIRLHETKQQLQQKADEIVQGELTIKADIEPSYIQKGSAEDMRQSYENQLQKAQKLQHDYDIGLIDYKAFKSTLAQMNEDLENLHLKPIILEVQSPLFKQLDMAADALDTFGGALSQLGDSEEDSATKAAGIIAQAIANIWLGYSKASAQAATMGPWAWVGFSVGALAQTIGIINAMKQNKYAGGGIVGGSRLFGDLQYVRVNSGEMLLNGSQQKRLFNLLDGGYTNFRGSNGSEVTFKVKGRDLIAVIHNQNDKMGKVR